MNTSGLVEWQILDPDSGLVMPWLTHPFLDELRTWDLSQATVLEFGAGRSTTWWRSRAKYVVSIEVDIAWALQVEHDFFEHGLHNGEIHCKKIADGTQQWTEYLALVPTMKYDLIIIDGIYRTECCAWAVKRGGIVIADNWQQDFVWISPEAEATMSPYQIHRFEQPGHTNHEGRKWNTSYWIIPKSSDNEQNTTTH